MAIQIVWTYEKRILSIVQRNNHRREVIVTFDGK